MSQPSKAVTFMSGEHKLEGYLHLPDDTPAAAVVICHPSAQYGGDMYNHVVTAICEALTERGIIALRFNMQGVGASEGQMSHATGADDTKAALEYLRSLREVESGSIGLLGYSAGAMAAAHAATADLKCLALISPPLGFDELPVEPGCPVLVAAGDHDEYAPIEKLRSLEGTPNLELTIIPNSEHFWHGTQDRLKEPVGSFFAKHLD